MSSCRSESSSVDLQKLLSIVDSARGEVGDAFILVVMSHGAEGVLYAADAIRIRIEVDLKTRIRKVLPGKPKMLMVVACQGSEYMPLILAYSCISYILSWYYSSKIISHTFAPQFGDCSLDPLDPLYLINMLEKTKHT